MSGRISFAKGSQDWGGRRKLNPDDAPRVDREDVRKFAHSYSISVKREGLGMWWRMDVNGKWWTLGMTNYLALKEIKRFVKEQAR